MTLPTAMQRSWTALPALGLLVGLCVWPGLQAGAAQPLHQQIDELILAGAGGAPAAESADDAEFLRRVYLDLAGRIPTVQEAKQFLADDAGDKRAKLIDRLLNGPDHPRRMAELFHVMLMERRGDDEHWQRFLRAAFEQNQPWDEIARAILRPDADDEQQRGAAFFYTARLTKEGAMAEVDVPGLTRDVGRLLAGRDLQCAQCHDHISVTDYTQRDFQGLHAFFVNIEQRRDVQFPAVSERLMTAPREFMSVFIQEPETTGPLVPGAGEVAIPTFAEGEEYLVPPDRKKRTPGVPKFSPLTQLAAGLADGRNEQFTRNIVNRLWHAMIGRGLVHPLDEHHAGNPASHPELLDRLAKEFAGQDFDIRWLLKQVALSRVYQRSSRLSAAQTEPPPLDRFLLARQRRVSAEQLLWSTLTALQVRDAVAGDEEQLEEQRQAFVKMYAAEPREPEVEFQPSVKGALFAQNNAELQQLFQRSDGNLIDRLAKLPDEAVPDELFLAVLSRPPGDADRRDLLELLQQSDAARDETLSRLAWALWASNEFFINH